jgi:hypothetical protein
MTRPTSFEPPLAMRRSRHAQQFYTRDLHKRGLDDDSNSLVVLAINSHYEQKYRWRGT